VPRVAIVADVFTSWFAAGNHCDSNGGARLCTAEQIARACHKGFSLNKTGWLADVHYNNNDALKPGDIGRSLLNIG